MICRGRAVFGIFIFLLTITTSLRLEDQEDTELIELKAQQQYLGSRVSSMLESSASTKERLAGASTDQQRIDILQQALFREKQEVFDLKNKLIYPFNESTTACQQLTDEEKIRILDELYEARADVEELEQINNKFDPSNRQVQNVSQSIQKQYILLDQIEAILKIECKENLSPTIFQSNLNAKNWVLGPQTMNDLQEEYSERALIFHNITNCPLITPFFNPRLEECIQCVQPDPLFNMYTKQCDRCDEDQEVDIQKKKCRSRPHYTNFSKVENWYLDGGQLPEIDPELTPCPDDRPYYNGVICTRCELPMYWNVAANLCKECDEGYKFDMNTKKCEQILRFELSLLQHTQWVADDLTQVIQDRIDVLELNKTTGQYHYCPTAMKPFYDGTTCIFCNIFDMNELVCVEPPEGLVYNDNMKKFVKPEVLKETNPSAKNYVTSTPLTDTQRQNCNQSYPYWDQIACVECVRPFQIFNVNQKKCSVCDADEIYVESSHICRKRDKIRISDNFNRLLATPKVSISQYKKNLIEKIQSSPDAIVYPCPGEQDYSNITNCFPCKQNEYFNVETYKCVTCDGEINPINKTCKAKVYIFTNLKAGKIVDMEGKTVDDENKRIASFLQTHPESYVCPLENPYAIDNKTCGTCPQLFSYSTLKCTACEEYQIYVVKDKQCKKANMLVNFTDSRRILVSQTQTLSSFKEQEEKVRSQAPELAKICPGGRPYTSSRDFCFNCSEKTPYFNYTVKACQACPDHYVFDSESVKCVQQFFIPLFTNTTEPKMKGYKNYSLEKFKQQEKQLMETHPYENCTQAEPYGTLTGCTQCSEPTPYFNIKKKVCADAKELIDFNSISEDYIVPYNKPLQDYKLDQEKFVNQTEELTVLCPSQTPYTKDRTYCFACGEEEHFNFETMTCEQCPQTKAYVNQSKRCEELFYVTNFTPLTEEKMKGHSNYTVEDYKTEQNKIKETSPFEECPLEKPYGTVNGCKQCVEPTPFFDIKKKICSSAKKLINFLGVEDNYLLGEDKQLKDYKETENNFKIYSESITAECDEATPYTSDRQFCFACEEPNSLFNFQTKKCQSCPAGTSYSDVANRCLSLVYLTNINNATQPMMIEKPDYSLENFKADEAERKQQNPFEECPEQTPYGTQSGCVNCQIPQQYFLLKTRQCTTVKRTINFEGVGDSYLTEEGKDLEAYKNQEKQFESNSEDPVLVCEEQTPYTNDRVECFACEEPNSIFDFKSKECTSCSQNQSYDDQTKKCIENKFYTLLTSATKENMIERGEKSIAEYEAEQLEVKEQKASIQCQADTPYASNSGCIACPESQPYFNIQTQKCEACGQEQQFFPDQHKCLKVAYLTDLQNPNIMVGQNLSLEEAKKQQDEKAAREGYVGINCTQPKPFATEKGCINCSTDSEKPYFNIETKECMGCVEFYQYFEDNQCKDNIVLINTKEMVGYIEVDNYTKYNIEKMNNFTYLQNDHVVDCPAEQAFYDGQLCLECPDDKPIFNLKDKKCVYIDILLKSNPDAMMQYIETGDETLQKLRQEIQLLNPRVNIELCTTDKPYLANNECIACPATRPYFNLGTQVCQKCGSQDNCFTK